MYVGYTQWLGTILKTRSNVPFISYNMSSTLFWDRIKEKRTGRWRNIWKLIIASWVDLRNCLMSYGSLCWNWRMWKNRQDITEDFTWSLELLFLQVDESFLMVCIVNIRLVITSPPINFKWCISILAMNKTDQCHPHVLLGLLWNDPGRQPAGWSWHADEICKWGHIIYFLSQSASNSTQRCFPVWAHYLCHKNTISMIITGFIYKLEHKASTLKISRGRRRGREKFNKSYV